MNPYYSFCDLPAPPSWLAFDVVRAAEVGLRTNQNLQFVRRDYADTDEHLAEYRRTQSEFHIGADTYSRAKYRRYNLSERSMLWIAENIGSVSQASSQVFTEGSAFYPHTDGGPRRYILNYLIRSGGPVNTVFYQEPGQDAVRDTAQPLNILDSNDLIELDRVEIPERTWTVLFGKVLHAVTGISGTRIQLSLALSAEEFVKVKERFGISLKYYG